MIAESTQRRERVANHNPRNHLIGGSSAFRSMVQIADSIAQRNSTVLISGETGVGKEMLARYIHERSNRADHPFVAVDCSTLSDGLFESELFGHVRGAFTGAHADTLGFIRAADHSTLFLDEIGELGLPLQAKLLRVLQERCVVPVGDIHPRPVDIRVISATNRDTGQMVEGGQLRADLYYRLNVVTLHVPPLRERRDDILAVAHHFLRIQAELYDEPLKHLSSEVVDALLGYDWPGNVRELANVIEHAHILAPAQRIELRNLPSQLQGTPEGDTASASSLQLDEVERRTIIAALDRAHYCKRSASRMLGINPKRLNRMISRLHISIP